jgi:hypothetical protein
MKTYRLSNTSFTVRVQVGMDGRITEAAPVVHRFIGQPFSNLLTWMGTFPGCEYQELSCTE